MQSFGQQLLACVYELIQSHLAKLVRLNIVVRLIYNVQGLVVQQYLIQLFVVLLDELKKVICQVLVLLTIEEVNDVWRSLFEAGKDLVAVCVL